MNLFRLGDISGIIIFHWNTIMSLTFYRNQLVTKELTDHHDGFLFTKQNFVGESFFLENYLSKTYLNKQAALEMMAVKHSHLGSFRYEKWLPYIFLTTFCLSKLTATNCPNEFLNKWKVISLIPPNYPLKPSCHEPSQIYLSSKYGEMMKMCRTLCWRWNTRPLVKQSPMDR